MEFLAEGDPNTVLDWQRVSELLDQFLKRLRETRPLKKVLIVPPDKTRPESGGVELTRLLFEKLAPTSTVEILPALGTHRMMSDQYLAQWYAGVPRSRIFEHRQEDVIERGVIPCEVVSKLSDGLLHDSIPVAVNRRLIEGGYDVILSVGQLVPHEVAGIANHAKNIFIGVGGSAFLDQSHYLSAIFGMERIMGRADNPVRALFDYAATHFAEDLPILYLLTVRDDQSVTGVITRGLFASDDRQSFERGAELCQKVNIVKLDRAPKKFVVRVPEAYESTWLANKAIYRTRMAIADAGELIVIGPNVREFGEQSAIDQLIRQHGYRGTAATLRAVASDPAMKRNLKVPAHLIHGSTEGRFAVTYAPGKLKRDEVESVGYQFADFEEMTLRYPATMKAGWNTLAGEEIYYIPDPGLNLWC